MPLRYTSTGAIALNSTGTIFDGSKKWCIEFTWAGVQIACFAVSGISGITHATFEGSSLDGVATAVFSCTGWSFDLGGTSMTARGYSGTPCVDGGGGNYVADITGLGPVNFVVTEAAGTYTVTATLAIGSGTLTVFSASGSFGAITSGGASLTLACP